MLKILYIAEGEIEERFITFLTQNDFIQSGRFKKFNLMQDRLKNNDSLLMKKVDKIYCILDTDVINSDNISNLIFNLGKLKDICSSSVLNLIQYKNFEGELRFILNCNDLSDLFKLPYKSTKDLKTFLAQKIVYRNYINKENLLRYCTRSDNFKQELKKYNQKFPINIVSIEKCVV